MALVKNSFVMGVAVCFALAIQASKSIAADTICPPNVVFNTVNGNLIVPANSTCLVVGATITGGVIVEGTIFISSSTVGKNVLVKPNGFWSANGVMLSGDLQASGAGANVSVFGGTMAHDVLVTNQSNITLNTATVAHDVQAIGANNVFIVSSTINKDLDIENSVNVIVSSSTIGGDLKCIGNVSVSTSGNSVGGETEGQCAQSPALRVR